MLQNLSDHFGIPELLDPIDYGEKDWAQEEFIGSCPVNIMSPGAMRFHKELRSSPHKYCYYQSYLMITSVRELKY